jgi:predicted MFS family arabinose efflux permease
VTAAVLLVGFVIWEHRSPRAMMPLTFFRIPAFSAGNAVAFSVSLGMFSIFLFFSLYMQSIRGYTAFQAGVRFLPMTLMIVATAPNAGKFAQKHGSKGPMTYGLVLTAVGLLAMTQMSQTTAYWLLAVAMAVMGHGMGSVMAPMTAAVMGAVGPQRAGLGSAMTNTSREVGGVLGIALLGTVLFDRLGAVLAPRLLQLGLSATQQASIAAAAGHGIPQPADLAKLGLTPEQQAGFYAAFRDAFMAGFHRATFIGAMILLTAAFVAFRFIPGRESTLHRAPVEEPAAVEASVEVLRSTP